MPDDTHSTVLDQTNVIWVHLYRPPVRIPLWHRLWGPVFSHVCIEWRNVIHDLPRDGVAEVYEAREHKALKAPAESFPIPVSEFLSPVDEGNLVDWIYQSYKGQRVDGLRSILWNFGLRTQRVRNCATLVCLWIRLLTNYEVDVGTPDQLFRWAVATVGRENDQRTKPA